MLLAIVKFAQDGMQLHAHHNDSALTYFRLSGSFNYGWNSFVHIVRSVVGVSSTAVPCDT